MKNLNDWLSANKISLNVRKTELVIYKHRNKKLECLIKIKLSKKRPLSFKISEISWG